MVALLNLCQNFTISHARVWTAAMRDEFREEDAVVKFVINCTSNVATQNVINSTFLH